MAWLYLLQVTALCALAAHSYWRIRFPLGNELLEIEATALERTRTPDADSQRYDHEADSALLRLRYVYYHDQCEDRIAGFDRRAPSTLRRRAARKANCGLDNNRLKGSVRTFFTPVSGGRHRCAEETDRERPEQPRGHGIGRAGKRFLDRGRPRRTGVRSS